MVNWGILILLLVVGCVDTENISNSTNIVEEVVIQETKTSDIYNIPIELTNNNPEFIELVEQLELQEAYTPYLDHPEADDMSNLPSFLVATFSSGFFKNNVDENDRSKQLFDHILSVCHETILTNFIDIYSMVSPYWASNLLESFISELPTNNNFIEQLIKSSTRFPYEYCYLYGLPKFQELWKAKIPISDDLTIDGEPWLHYLVTKIPWSVSPIRIITSNYPSIRYDRTNSNGYSIIQQAIKSGEDNLLEWLVNNVPTNPKEVTDKNETWLDLACQLPRYNTYIVEAEFPKYNSTRKYVVEELAPKYGIAQNISLTDEIYYDSSQPRSLRSIQAKIMETNKNYTPIYSFLLDQRHQKLFNENIPHDLSILEFINFGKGGYDVYDPEIYLAYDKLVQILVDEVEVSPYIIDEWGNNALVYALDNEKLFEFFLAKGVDIYHINTNGKNLLHHALPQQNGTLIGDSDFPVSIEFYKKHLRKLKIDLNQTNNYGTTPFNQYRSGGCAEQEFVDLLIKDGGDPNIGKYEPEGMCVG